MVLLRGKKSRISESNRYHEDLLHFMRKCKMQPKTCCSILTKTKHTNKKPESQKNRYLLEHSTEFILKASRSKLISELKTHLKKMDTQLFLVHQRKENTICARLYQSKTTTILEYPDTKHVYICLQVL